MSDQDQMLKWEDRYIYIYEKICNHRRREKKNIEPV